MPGLSENLIILGAGTTAAVAGLPTAPDFFSKNEEWSTHRRDYPHLSAAYDHLLELETKQQLTLTDVWRFIDTLTKYHSGVVHCDSYDYNLLLKRQQSLPPSLIIEALNQKWMHLRRKMYPRAATMDNKKIYKTFPRRDGVNYFLILAGWELKHLIYRTYSSAKETEGYYGTLIEKLRNESLAVSIVNFNYDIYFEKACRRKDQLLELVYDEQGLPQNAIALCKPHGGWNILHVDQLAFPFPTLSDSVDEKQFDRFEEGEIRPAMIPYFSGPDEIKEEHKAMWPGVGAYFMNQWGVMKRMLAEAKRIVSIGYSFSDSDQHVREAIEELGDSRHEKRLLCILKRDSDWNKTTARIRGAWSIDKGIPEEETFRCAGFNEGSVEDVLTFFRGVR